MGARGARIIQDVIRAEGPRVPARDVCHWKAAFLIVHPANTPPTPAQIARVDAYRRRWEQYYPIATDQRGSFDTTLAGTGRGTASCPAPGTPVADGGPRIEDAAPADGGALIEAGPGGGEDGSIASREDASSEDAGVIAGRDAEDPGRSAPAPSGGKTLKADGCSCRGLSSDRPGSDHAAVPAAILAILALRQGIGARACRRRPKAATRTTP